MTTGSPGELSSEQLWSALAAQRSLFGADEEVGESLPRALRWLRLCWEAGEDHLPLLVVHDLGHLLLRGRAFRFASTAALADWDTRERALRLRYEDRILGHWLIDPSVRDAHVAVAGLTAEIADRAIAHAVALALAEPLRRLRMAAGNPAWLRDGAQALGMPEVDEGWADWGRALLSTLVEALPTGRLLSPEDLWEIAHLEALPSDSARLALRELHAAVSAIGALPGSDLLRVRQRAREVPVALDAADTYPTGGFDAVATRGSFENIVRTEIVYVGEGGLEGGVDLFDVRFTESELLFYTRDENPLLDAVRAVTLILDHPAALRTKHARSPAQTLVLADAVALVLQGDLVRTFGPAGSRVEIAWCASSDADLEVIGEERSLLSLTLAAELSHGRVQTALIEAIEDEGPARGRIVLSPRAAPGRFQGLWLRVDGDRWRWGDEEIDTASWAELRSLCNRLLLAIVGG